MAVRDVLLKLNGCPEPAACRATDSAADTAGRADADLSASLCGSRFPMFQTFHRGCSGGLAK
jgi:hypothetical protein